MDIENLEKKIAYTFNDKELLRQAITHSSYANEQKIYRAKNYERIEFLGDAVLELVSSDYLFFEHPFMPEGEMTKLRSTLVCEQALAYCARELELGNYLLLGKGEEATGGRNRDSIIADVVEAIIGAIYLDGGFDKAKDFIHAFVLSDLENKKLFNDSKTLLQEMVQKECNSVLHYQLLDEIGPEHNKIFVVAAMLNEKQIGKGEGKTKKAAEQQAAYKGVLFLKKEK